MAAQFARRLALISFATAVLRGLLCGADFFGVLQTALVSLGVFFLLGLMIGEAARRIVEENVKADLARSLELTPAPGASVQRP